MISMLATKNTSIHFRKNIDGVQVFLKDVRSLNSCIKMLHEASSISFGSLERHRHQSTKHEKDFGTFNFVRLFCGFD